MRRVLKRAAQVFAVATVLALIVGMWAPLSVILTFKIAETGLLLAGVFYIAAGDGA